jgi:hypothetical protein
MFVAPTFRLRKRGEHQAPAASCVQEKMVKRRPPLPRCRNLRSRSLPAVCTGCNRCRPQTNCAELFDVTLDIEQIRPRRRRPTNIAASGASNRTQRPARETPYSTAARASERAPTSAGVMSETRLSSREERRTSRLAMFVPPICRRRW